MRKIYWIIIVLLLAVAYIFVMTDNLKDRELMRITLPQLPDCYSVSDRIQACYDKTEESLSLRVMVKDNDLINNDKNLLDSVIFRILSEDTLFLDGIVLIVSHGYNSGTEYGELDAANRYFLGVSFAAIKVADTIFINP